MSISSRDGDDDEVKLSIRMFHGGKLNELHKDYVGGKLTVFDHWDLEVVTLESLHKDVRALGYGGILSLYYRKPGVALEEGLVFIRNEEEVQNMKGYSSTNENKIDVFVRHYEGEIFIGDNPYQYVCPEEQGHEGNGSSGVGDWSDEVDSEYSMTSDDDKLFSANVDEGVEWVGRIRERLGLESDDGDSECNERDSGHMSDSDSFQSILEEASYPAPKKKSQGFTVYKDSDNPRFEVGMLFKDHTECREAIIKHSYVEGRMISFVKSDKTRVKAACKSPCPWFMFASINWDKTFQLKKVGPAHTCVRQQKKLPLIHSGFLARKYLQEFRMNPKWPISAFHKRVIQDLSIDFPAHVLRRAKRGCLRIINGTDADQYAKLWDYRLELLKKNPTSTIEFEFEAGKPGVFKRMYVCLGGIKSGFKLGCRKVIGLDGTHLKNAYKGILLTAVAVDPNNCMYPLCYAVVEAEKLDTWGWFLDLLIREFEMGDGFGWTLISDRQKGLLNVMQNMLPAAEHRYCIRHIHNNFKQQYKGRSLKDKLWACARAPNVEAFNSAMEEVKSESQGAYDWLTAIPPQHWTRSHFKTDVKCDILLNNMCESFNKSILLAREQGILVMLEMIRDYLMERLQSKREKMTRWGDRRFTPKILVLVEKFKKWTRGCYPAYSGYNQFEVTTVNGSKFAVDLNTWTCGCRRWDITGIPCHHAIMTYIHYDVAGFVHPMNGEGLWEKTGFVILPPTEIEKQPGRPKRKRRADGNDQPLVREKDGVKILSRRSSQKSIRCGICKEEGHNRATCPQKPDDAESSAQKKPRKNAKKITPPLVQIPPTEENPTESPPIPPATGNEPESENAPTTEIVTPQNNLPLADIQPDAENPPAAGNDEPLDHPPVTDNHDCILEMNVDDDAPVNTQATQDDHGEPLQQDEIGDGEGGDEENEEESEEDSEEDLPPLEVASKKIQKMRFQNEEESKLRWLIFEADLLNAREKVEARLRAEKGIVIEDVQVEAPAKKGKQVIGGPIRRSQRLISQTGGPSQCLSGFKNTKDKAIILDDDDDDCGSPDANSLHHKLKPVRAPENKKLNQNVAPPNYTGPNLVGNEPLSPLKEYKARLGGIVIKTQCVFRDGQPVITKDQLVKALAEARKMPATSEGEDNNQNKSPGGK